MKNPKKSSTEPEEILWNSIAMFEKILEAMPEDRISLDAMAEAYIKVGDYTRGKDYLLRLGKVIIKEKDEDATYELLEKLRKLDQNDPQVRDTITKIEEFKPEKIMADVLEDTGKLSRRSLNITAEISFAWNLLQAKKLSEDNYRTVVQTLSETATENLDTPVSTLYALSDMKLPGFNDILSFISKTCNIPIISLANFDLNELKTNFLPFDFVLNRGAIPFEQMGNDALIGILNPYNEQLQSDVETLIVGKCHFYLVTPEDFDRAVKALKKSSQKAKEPQKTAQS